MHRKHICMYECVCMCVSVYVLQWKTTRIPTQASVYEQEHSHHFRSQKAIQATYEAEKTYDDSLSSFVSMYVLPIF